MLRHPSRKLVALALFSGIFITPLIPNKALGQLDLDDLFRIGKLADALKHCTERLDDMIDKAAMDGDFLVEKNARMLKMSVQDLKYIMADQLDRTKDQVSEDCRLVVSRLGELIEQVKRSKGGLLKLEDFLALDLDRIVVRLVPHFTTPRPAWLIRRIDGYSQVYQEDGVYTFKVVGAAFGPEFSSRVVVNGDEVFVFSMKTPRAYTLEFDVPVNVLNPKFRDDKPERAEIEFESKGGDLKKPFQYKDKILLLPKKPVEYELNEQRLERDWTKEVLWMPRVCSRCAEKHCQRLSRCPGGDPHGEGQNDISHRSRPCRTEAGRHT